MASLLRCIRRPAASSKSDDKQSVVTATSTSILDLPNEALLRVVTRAWRCRRSLLSMRLVCKQFDFVACSLVGPLCLGYDTLSRKFELRRAADRPRHDDSGQTPPSLPTLISVGELKRVAPHLLKNVRTVTVVFLRAPLNSGDEAAKCFEELFDALACLGAAPAIDLIVDVHDTVLPNRVQVLSRLLEDFELRRLVLRGSGRPIERVTKQLELLASMLGVSIRALEFHLPGFSVALAMNIFFGSRTTPFENLNQYTWCSCAGACARSPDRRQTGFYSCVLYRAEHDFCESQCDWDEVVWSLHRLASSDSFAHVRSLRVNFTHTHTRTGCLSWTTPAVSLSDVVEARTLRALESAEISSVTSHYARLERVGCECWQCLFALVSNVTRMRLELAYVGLGLPLQAFAECVKKNEGVMFRNLRTLTVTFVDPASEAHAFNEWTMFCEALSSGAPNVIEVEVDFMWLKPVFFATSNFFLKELLGVASVREIVFRYSVDATANIAIRVREWARVFLRRSDWSSVRSELAFKFVFLLNTAGRLSKTAASRAHREVLAALEAAKKRQEIDDFYCDVRWLPCLCCARRFCVSCRVIDVVDKEEHLVVLEIC